jgi:hypothetical protein
MKTPPTIYVLRLKVRWLKGRTTYTVVRELQWDNESDALGCRDLMLKSKVPKFLEIEFARVQPEQPL